MLVALYLRFHLRLCRCSYVKNSTTIEINNPQYKYARETCLQFSPLVGELPEWNILVTPWTLVLYVIYCICTCTRACDPRACAYCIHVYHIKYSCPW